MKITFQIFFSLLSISLYSQQIHSPLNHEINSVVEEELYKKSSNFHTSVRPFYQHEIQEIYNQDSINNTLKGDNRIYLLGTSWWAKSILWTERKVLDDDLIKAKKGVLTARINPVLHLSKGKDRTSGNDTWQNTRGFFIEGKLGEKFFFNTAFYESQGLFLPQVNAYMNQTFIVPGQGRAKPFGAGPATDWGISNGSIVYKANKTFTFQFGHDKNFIGDGYRSLLLSDNATNYPFLKIETNFWKFKYVNIYAQTNHIGFAGSADRLFDRKYFSAKYLSWNATRWLNFSLFEVVSWRSVPTREFDVNYLNPVIFMRPVEYQNGSSDNMLLGATSKIKITSKISIYGQLALDDLRFSEFKNGTYWWGNKYAVQGGLKIFDLFTLPGLSVQGEYNYARPFTYTHFDSINAYTHLNQPLAHPLGANFKEGIAFLRYNYKRHFIQIRYSQALFGLDTANINHGQNIFYSYNTNKVNIEGEDGDFGHRTLQGLKTNLTILDVKYSFLINPCSKLMFDIGLTNRSYTNALVSDKNNYIYFGIRTSLQNFYYDFL